MGSANKADERLLHVLAEQIKLPLLQIALQAESDSLSSQATLDIARSALRLIDAYILASGNEAQVVLPLEPVSLSATLQDVAHALQPHAQRYNCEIQVQLAGRYGPVMAHQAGLESALTVLGQSFIESQTEPAGRIVLAAHRSTHGLVAGVFDAEEAITTDMFRRAKALQGAARQPLTTGSAGNGAGVFVANSLLELMAAPLKVARHAKLSGLASTFVPSQQLSFLT